MGTFIRRFFSPSSFNSLTNRYSARPKRRVRLGLETLEHRTVPAIAVITGSQLLIIPDTAGETISLSSGPDGTLNVTGGNGLNLNFPTTFTNILVDGTVKNVAFTFQASEMLDVESNISLDGILQVACLTGTAPGTTVDYSNWDAEQLPSVDPIFNIGIFFMTDFGACAGQQTYKAPLIGISVVKFHDQPAAGNTVTIDTGTGENSTFLDFGDLSSAVNVNLSVPSGGELASYANNTTFLEGSSDRIAGARGGEGDNTFVGDPSQQQYFIGGLGNSNISVTGTGMTDQINAVYDLSPSLAGTIQTTGYLKGTYAWDRTSVVNLNTFGEDTYVDLSGVPSASFPGNPVAFKLFSDNGMFDIGGNNPASIYDPSASITPPVLMNKYKATVTTGTANAYVFGYQNVSLTAIGNGGNNDFEDDSGALPSYLSGGDGTCILQGAAGDTLIAGNGNTTISLDATNASSTLVTTLVTGDGTGSVAASSLYITIDVGVGTYDLNNLLNDSSVILIYNDLTTLNGTNLSANTSLIPSLVKASTR